MPAGLGARYLGAGRCEFLVWAPKAKLVELNIVAPKRRRLPLAAAGAGYHWAALSDAEPGTEYFYRLDGGPDRPDPASRAQPRGVHGPSAVADPAFSWKTAGWKGLPLERFVVYETHIGTFSPEGTFAGAIPYLDAVKELGATVVSVMPVAQFPGARNWGYDGVCPFAVQDSYGGAREFKRFVDACHLRGLGVMLDVVYNHLGPEGNYLRDFGPYFTAGYKTPWGEALNFDGPGSDEVRRFFVESAVRWLEEFRVDALRLDAVHAIRDFSARPFIEELAAAAHELGRRQGRAVNIIAESSLNDPRVIRPPELGGLGCDAQYCKDFHHSLHAALTGERSGRYGDFTGLRDLAASYRDAFVYTGQYSPMRKRRFGRGAEGRPGRQFLVYAQDHDEVGNRPLGERLAGLVDFEALKLAAGAVAFSPFLPLLFMGEEYGEKAPFHYFTSHSDKALSEAVRLGRQADHGSPFGHGGIPAPGDKNAFLRSRLDRKPRRSGRPALLEKFYRRLYALRREQPALALLDREGLTAALHEEAGVLAVHRRAGAEENFFVMNFARMASRVRLELPGGRWTKLLDSAQPQWGGPGSPAAGSLAGGQAELALAPGSLALYGRSAADRI